jgi:integrase
MSDAVSRHSYVDLKKATVGRVAKEWKEVYQDPTHGDNDKNYKPSVIASDNCVIKRIVEKWEYTQITALTRKGIRKWEKELHAEYEPNSVRNTLRMLHKLIKFAIENDYLTKDVMADYHLNRNTDFQRQNDTRNANDEETAGKVVSFEALTRLLMNCAALVKIVCLIAFYSGLRRNEIFSLFWTPAPQGSEARSYIDFDGNRIVVRQSVTFLYGKALDAYKKAQGDGAPNYKFLPPKKNSSREVPLAPELKKALLQYKLSCSDKEGLVFQTSDKDGKPTGRPIDPNNVMRYTKREQPFDASKTGKPRASFDAACWQAGVSIHFHWLRHTFGSVMLAHLGKTDGSIFTVSKMMGHSSLQVTADIYGHKIGSQEDHDNIADAFSAFSMGGNNAAAGQSSQAVN